MANPLDDMTKEKHESFGQIRFSRVNGDSRFYGSQLEQNNFITMDVYHSYTMKDLSKEHYFTEGLPLISVRMSAGQFAELITSMNVGGGVPCTIEMVDGKRMEKLPIIEDRKSFVHSEFKKRMKVFADTIRERQKEAKELVKKKTLSKDDQQKLNFALEWLTSEIENNIPFFAECFQETMDDVVKEAKMEVENAIQHKISTLGLMELQKQNQLLLNDNGKQDS